MAIERGWDGSNTTIFMSVAVANGPETNDGARQWYLELSRLLPGFEQVTPPTYFSDGRVEDEGGITGGTTSIGGTNGIQIDCEATLDGAYTATRNIVSSIPQGNNILLFGVDDDCALGALRALDEADIGGEIMACGEGAYEDGVVQLRDNPAFVCTAGIFITDTSMYAIAMAVAVELGMTIPDWTPAPQVMLTADNIDEYYEVSELEPYQLPPLVDGNRYLLDTGVFETLGASFGG
jgi:ribose transport system substrate-binding protein